MCIRLLFQGDDDIWMCNSVTNTVDHYKSVVQVVVKDNAASPADVSDVTTIGHYLPS